MSLNSVVESVTARVIERSKVSRRRYLALMERNREKGVSRPRLACGNLAHAIAAAGADKPDLMRPLDKNIGMITTYNDMLSAHQPYGHYPDQIKLFAREAGATAQVAGGAPAMCDGVTQGQEGMELSLFSRDVIAMSTAVGLSHGMFNSVALLGVCDKIVPGLLMGALRFGHLPTMLIPAGPMTSGLPNKEKLKIRQLFVEGKVGKEKLMEAENASYHGPGTCTFYGTANTNQMIVEIMGLMMPDSAFIPTNTPLRQAMTRASIHRLAEISINGDDERSLAKCVDEKAIVNAAIGLLATGGSTNLTIHLPAIARAAGIVFDWEDFSRLSAEVPLITHVYPNGSEDVNAFNRVGGMPTVISELIDADLLHTDILTISRGGMKDYTQRASLSEDGKSVVYNPSKPSSDPNILRGIKEPFSSDGGIKLLEGNIGRAIYKSSAIKEKHLTVEAPARVFIDQKDVATAYQNGELERDVVVVVRFQGPEANGMPELHKLTPALGVLQDRGFNVALITDGRMSGASGKVPAAVHVVPEAQDGGPIAKIKDGDIVRVCAVTGRIEVLADPHEWEARKPAQPPLPALGTGREMFALMRSVHLSAERGASAMIELMEKDLDAVGDNIQ
ncbi:phosphogluconate dehydratase [Swingsia samuiensis]|uniref:Phosphogluconate dehydratase n=1 Tax=Swingsia samuiensis TaxID=1293412 RepID=A0A4Y6UL34_9PROT|nr:phosphogluconate dehydratase [Swingsia samuiensis]QDH17348.1 phosphogluconate dehydratase [Swingsia samuiensis]